MQGENFAERCIQTTLKHGGGGMMKWGCMTSKGVGLLKKVDGRLNGGSYVNILENNLIPSIHLHSLTGISIFQQDNSPCHQGRVAKEWFQSENIDVMDWPSQSLDLNPIEHLWDQIATRVQSQNPSNHAELWSEIRNAWDQIEGQKIVTLFQSM